ncbi:hypothetical protein AIDNDMCJ_19222 (plasmid) [Bacillus safensis]|uniref:Uncharacterized protein n=1 Tax=Bacillus pumilus TaxID=1408 RepID=A0A9Q9PCL6_BACPU|nr:hypothetical protein SBRMV_029 [Bacillus pumilus]VCT99223.1 hypothetical protein AIDNDMCJ_19222 [Bacillus safensis]
MNCKHCKKNVRSKVKYYEQQKMCSSCFKAFKKIGETWGN